MKIERVELLRLNIPLVKPFETSFGRDEAEVHIIVKLYSNGLIGYGESPVPVYPGYCYETFDTAWNIQTKFLAPALIHKEINEISDFENHIKRIRGHNFAKHGFECAVWHLFSQIQQKPVHKMLGGTRKIIQSGVSVGIHKSIDDLLKTINGFLQEGYRRIKIKIKPGWDYEPIKAIRENFGDIPLMGDANSAYSLKDIELFKRLDKFNLMMIEQPLQYEDLTEHAVLQGKIKTSICLDESIANVATARAAIALKSCRIINIKPARVGGLVKAIQIHNLCQENGMPVWCGGMLEMGIGRAFNIALSTLPNFKLPGDVSSSKKYFHQDIVTPEILFKNGELRVSDEPGLGFLPDEDAIKKFSEKKFEL